MSDLMEAVEYLVSYGLLGEFGRFRASRPLAARRGTRAVIRSHRGVEAGTVLCSATPRHARYLPNTTVGQLLRLVSPEDEQKLRLLRQRGQEVLQRAALLADQLQLPLEWLDGEMLLDGEHVVLHHLRGGDCDVRPLVSTLSREFALHVLLQDLTRPVEPAPAEDEEHGCGRENCGAGNCGSCGTEGGCGSCGAPSDDAQSYFAGLRQKMEQRVPLL